MKEIEQLRAENAQLKKQLAEASKIISELRKKISHVEKENQKLHAQLRKFLNENTPSSAIPPHLKETLEIAVKEIKEREEKEGQENNRNARAKTHDRKEEHILLECPDCKGSLTRKKRRCQRRIIHIKLPETENVLHECNSYYCKNCKKEFTAKVPDALPKSKFDLTTLIFISYLFVGLNMSIGNIRSIFKEIFGLEISEGTISNSLKRLNEYLGDEYSELEKKVKNAKVRYKDETGWRFNGKTFWNWVVSTKNDVLYRIEKSRSHTVAKSMQSDSGVDVSDRYRAYDKLNSEKQKCWSHLLRMARKPEHGFTDERETAEYIRLVEGLGKIFHDAKENKKTLGVSEKLKKIYDERLEEHLKSIKWLGKNADKLMNYIMAAFGEWFTFLQYEEVEPTNNEAERMLRHAVIKRKISQQNRSLINMESYQKQISILMSCRKRSVNYVDYLSNVLEKRINELGNY